MLASLKSEFKKLLTVRSTYIITTLVLIAVAFFSVYVYGYQQEALRASDSGFIADVIYSMLGMFAYFGTIIAILLVTHEYRYNTISYTLTASSSRIRVLLSKTIVALSYTFVVGIAVTLVAYFGAKWGLSMSGDTLVAQNAPFWELVWRFGAYIAGYTLVGLILGALIRGVVGAIVVFFMTPLVEQLIGQLLGKNAEFLPFRALEAIANNSFAGVTMTSLTNLTALGVFAIYLAIAGTTAAVLFVKRDASS